MDFSRNIGLITQEQQKQLEQASVTICGAGGMGGVCGEVLVRMGIGKLTMIDHDQFEASNCNRQIHCNKDTLGRFKAEVLKEEFQKINPSLEMRVFTEPVGLDNVKKILEGTHIVVNGMDQMHPSICLEREARRREIPIVDAWITPYASVFTMSPQDPHWEQFLGLPTYGKSEESITKEDCTESLRREVDYTFSHFEPYQHASKELIKDIVDGKAKRPSLAPVVWLSGVLMANEVFKIVAGYKPIGPRGVFYDQYEHRLTPGNAKI